MLCAFASTHTTIPFPPNTEAAFEIQVEVATPLTALLGIQQSLQEPVGATPGVTGEHGVRAQEAKASTGTSAGQRQGSSFDRVLSSWL